MLPVERLSQASFGASGLYLEKFVANARHIEVQIFGDGDGRVVALGERDCSAQRRNQKVIEETPAPGLSAESRACLLATAVRLGQAVRYRNAGTVEFVYDNQSNEFYFLEVNARLQVEHGVTEEVSGVDLVEWMVRGEIGSMRAPRGHAIQVRIYAEDPAHDFQPAAGRLTHVEWPPGVRVETWVESGTEVTPYYDPMLAKVIVHGADRREALARLRAALHQTRIYGIETNLEYLRQVLRLRGSSKPAASPPPSCAISIIAAMPSRWSNRGRRPPCRIIPAAWDTGMSACRLRDPWMRSPSDWPIAWWAIRGMPRCSRSPSPVLRCGSHAIP